MTPDPSRALPGDDLLYAALLARDPAFEGRAFVGVTTTGIVCRLTCPARKPKRENTLFFDALAAALAAGFRPCKRCRPQADDPAPDGALMAGLLARLDGERRGPHQPRPGALPRRGGAAHDDPIHSRSPSKAAGERGRVDGAAAVHPFG